MSLRESSPRDPIKHFLPMRVRSTLCISEGTLKNEEIYAGGKNADEEGVVLLFAEE